MYPLIEELWIRIIALPDHIDLKSVSGVKMANREISLSSPIEQDWISFVSYECIICIQVCVCECACVCVCVCVCERESIANLACKLRYILHV